jgi:hypothetical protein
LVCGNEKETSTKSYTHTPGSRVRIGKLLKAHDMKNVVHKSEPFKRNVQLAKIQIFFHSSLSSLPFSHIRFFCSLIVRPFSIQSSLLLLLTRQHTLPHTYFQSRELTERYFISYKLDLLGNSSLAKL